MQTFETLTTPREETAGGARAAPQQTCQIQTEYATIAVKQERMEEDGLVIETRRAISAHPAVRLPPFAYFLTLTCDGDDDDDDDDDDDEPKD